MKHTKSILKVTNKVRNNNVAIAYSNGISISVSKFSKPYNQFREIYCYRVLFAAWSKSDNRYIYVRKEFDFAVDAAMFFVSCLPDKRKIKFC